MISIDGYVMGTDIYKEVFPCDLDNLNIDRELEWTMYLPPLRFFRKRKIHSSPPFGGGGVKMLWGGRGGPRVYVYTFVSTSKHIYLPIEFGQFSEK